MLLAFGEIVFDNLCKTFPGPFDSCEIGTVLSFQAAVHAYQRGRCGFIEAGGLCGYFAGEIFRYGPGSESSKTKAPGIIEFFNRPHQRDITFADQIEQIRPAGHMLARDTDHKSEICLDYSSFYLFCLG